MYLFSRLRTQPQIEDDLKYKDDLKNEDDLKMKTASKWRWPENEDDLKIAEDLKNEKSHINLWITNKWGGTQNEDSLNKIHHKSRPIKSN